MENSQRTYGVNDLCFYVFDADSNSRGFRIRTDKILEPTENNTYSLGSATVEDNSSTKSIFMRVE